MTAQPKRKSNHPMLYLTLLIGICMHGTTEGARSKESRSQEGTFEVVIDRDTSLTTVYRTTNGDRSMWYSIPGELGQIFFSSDGRHAAACEPLLDEGYHAKSVVVRFYSEGQIHDRIRLKDLVKKVKNLELEGARFRWGQCSGFAGNGATFEIYTIEKKRISYNFTTKKRQTAVGAWPPASTSASAENSPTMGSTTRAPEIENSPALATIFPDPCKAVDLFCDRFKDYKAGWKQARGKWEYRTDRSDGDRLLYQRSALPRESNALMYFDNLNISDADVSTLLKMDLEFPQIAIKDDDDRVRRMRRFSGAGLVFRLQNADNYYMFRLAGEEGAVLGKMVNGKWRDIANPRAVDFLNENLHFRNRWYALRVRMQDSLIKCWITEWIVEGDALSNREQAVVSVRDDTFSTGKAGLVTFEAKALFSHFRVTEID